MKVLVFLLSFYGVQCALFYDSYTGNQITFDDYKRHVKANTSFWCINELKPCNSNEGRRIDGTCNNLQHPTRGAVHTPFFRVLPTIYGKNFEPRKTKRGFDLPLARYLRTRLLSEGRVASQKLTQLSINYLVFTVSDVVSQQDTVNYVLWKPYCCTAKGKMDHECTPNKVPADDPVHRFSDIRCMNMTRPMSFQSVGCVRNDTVPDRIVSATPLFELSIIYGTSEKVLLQKARAMKGGLLKTEISNGKIWPPSTKTPVNVCLLNEPPHETRCHDTPSEGPNTLSANNMLSVWFWRYHNFIAKELALSNPCWNDTKLFEVARDINLAVYLQIFYYELMPAFFGHENMAKYGAIATSNGFRDVYDEEVPPQMSIEFLYVLRYVHTMQNGDHYLYDKKGHYLKKVPTTNMTLRTGLFEIDNNMEGFTQGAFRQGCGDIDYIVDPEVSESGIPKLQKSSDILTNDLAKSRYFGFQSYAKYREYCFGKKITYFNDLNGVIDPERIEILRELYDDVDDIDLLAGIWLERPMQGGITPPTFFCLTIQQLVRNVVSDRHWYERPNRPNAFTYPQLLEIRKMTIARLLCDVGDGVTEIQPQAFLRAGPGNRIASCDYLPSISFKPWQDPKCFKYYWKY